MAVNGYTKDGADALFATKGEVTGGFVARRVYMILAVGQSNMSGRGKPFTSFTDPGHPRIWQYPASGGPIIAAQDPLRMHDYLDPTAGISPAMQFARHLIAEIPSTDQVLIVPAAHGGTGLCVNTTPLGWRWGVSGNLSAQAVAQYTAAVSAAQATWSGYTIVPTAILWHQGESDTAAGADQYHTDLAALAAGFRGTLGSDVPFIVGALVPEGVTATAGREQIDYALGAFPYRIARSGYAAGPSGFTYDNLHYTARGVRTLGDNYWAEYQRIQGGLRAKNIPRSYAGARWWAESFATPGNVVATAFPADVRHPYVEGWTIGSSVSISTGKVTFTGTSGTRRLIVCESGLSDGIISAKYLTAAAGTSHLYAIGRYTGTNNFIYAQLRSDNTIVLSKMVAGTSTDIGSPVAHTRVANDIISLKMVGDQVSVLCNGSQVIAPTTITDLMTATKHGAGNLGSTGITLEATDLTFNAAA